MSVPVYKFIANIIRDELDTETKIIFGVVFLTGTTASDTIHSLNNKGL